jgi:hypothetical protein
MLGDKISGQIMLQTIHHILKKINQEHVLYRTLEVLGTYLSHPMVQRLADIGFDLVRY